MFNLAPMSTVTEIRAAIENLNEQDRNLLMADLLATMPLPHESDSAFLAALDRGIADDEADRVHSLEEVDALASKWISKSHSPKAL